MNQENGIASKSAECCKINITLFDDKINLDNGVDRGHKGKLS